MIKGVTEEQEKIIQKILSPYKEEYEFYYYGSRVKGNFSKLSDLDVLIRYKNLSENKSFENVLELKTLFDISDLPYIVNVVDYNSIDEHFYKLIENDLVKVIL